MLRYVLGRALGGFTESAVFGRMSGVRLADVPPPDLPGERWIGAEVIAGGICGTDLGTLTFNTSPLMEPFASFPCVLVIGSGPIAFAAIWALRALGFDGEIVAQAKRPRERDLAERLGATQTVTPGDSARGALLQTGAAAYRPPVGPEVYAGGGFPLIYDCVGNRHTLDQALRFVAPRGKLVLLGCAGARKLDLTMVWAREVSIRGVLGYGRERWDGETLHTYELTQRLLLASDASLADLVTHTYPLHQYRGALAAARHRGKSGAVKVLLTP